MIREIALGTENLSHTKNTYLETLALDNEIFSLSFGHLCHELKCT